ncbi:MAG: hypothetical protein EON95_05910 [Caulobacteraceae bacterium]|nr:MAG: hypothetical protein EON95_05910 [Caulobacteraceae bacterium]
MRALPFALVLLTALAGPALAARPIALDGQKPLSAAADAFPRIVEPAGPRTDRINQALTRADARGRKAMKDCGQERGVAFERSVTAPMTGQPFLTLIASDFASCGGAHPSIFQMALTYDLGTGRPINWADYLPADLVKPEVLVDIGDGSQLGAVQAPALLAFYRAAAKAQRQDRNCDEVYDGAEGLYLWIDAKAGGMAMSMTGVPHAVQACDDPVVMSTAELRKRGAKPALTDAIDAASKSKHYQ